MATKKTTGNPELEAAWGVEPHLENIRAARAHIRDYRESREEPAGVGAVSSAVVEGLLAGEPVPKDLSKRIRAAVEAEETYQRETALLLNVARAVESSEARVRARAAHAGLARLHERVVEIVDGAREVRSVLGGVESGDAAMEAGRKETEAWRELVGLAGQYRQVREAQRVLVAAATGGRRIHGGFGETLSTVGEFRDYEGLWPRRVREQEVTFSVRRGERWVSPPPWPHREDGAPTREPAFLLWAAGQDENPLWVPSVEELVNARGVKDTGRPAPKADAERQEWEERMDKTVRATSEALAGRGRRQEAIPGEDRIRARHDRVRAGFGPGVGDDLSR